MKGRGAVGKALLLTAGILLLSGCQGFAALDQPPVAKFTVTPDPDGPKTEIRVGDLVTLDASGSSDPQGYDLSYEWDLRKPYQSEARLSSTTGKKVTFYPDVNSQFTISLTVTARVQSAISGTRILSVGNALSTNSKGWLTVAADPYGTVEPLGFRPLDANESLPIKAVPKKGYKFHSWTSDSAAALVADATAASTSVTLPLGFKATVTANFVPSALPPSFLAWTTATGVPSALAFVRVDGSTGSVKLLGGDLVIVSLALSPTKALYGLGDLISPRGATLYRLDATGNNLSGMGVPLKDSTGAPVTGDSAAFSPNGTLFVVERKADVSRVFTANLTTGVMTLVGTPLPALDSLAFDPKTGDLFGTDGTDLYQLDSKASATKVGSFGGVKLTSLTFAADGRLFGMERAVSQTSLYSVDLVKGSATLLVPLTTGLLALLAEP